MTVGSPKGPERDARPAKVSLRDRIAQEISEVDGHASSVEPCGDATYEQMADAALTVMEPEYEWLCAEVDRQHRLAGGWFQRSLENGRYAERLREQLATAQDDLVAQNRMYRRVGAERDEKQFEVERLRRWVDRFRGALKPSMDGLTEEEADLIETAMRAVEAGSAGHWPTVAGWLHVEVLRLRGALAPRAPVSESVPATPQRFDNPSARVSAVEGLPPAPTRLVSYEPFEGRPSGSERLAPRPVSNLALWTDDDEIVWEVKVVDIRQVATIRLVDEPDEVREVLMHELSPLPRVWHKGDPEPDDHPPVVDRHGDVWTHVPGTFEWSSPETQNCSWSYMARKWDPLTEVVPTAPPVAAQAARSEASPQDPPAVVATETEPSGAVMTECPDGAQCHRECVAPACIRVATCGPMSRVFPSDRWPHEVVAKHGPGSLTEVPSPSLRKEGGDTPSPSVSTQEETKGETDGQA